MFRWFFWVHHPDNAFCLTKTRPHKPEGCSVLKEVGHNQCPNRTFSWRGDHGSDCVELWKFSILGSNKGGTCIPALQSEVSCFFETSISWLPTVAVAGFTVVFIFWGKLGLAIAMNIKSFGARTGLWKLEITARRKNWFVVSAFDVNPRFHPSGAA